MSALGFFSVLLFYLKHQHSLPILIFTCITYAGLSDDILDSGMENEVASADVSQDIICEFKATSDPETKKLCDGENMPDFFSDHVVLPVNEDGMDHSCSKEWDRATDHVPVQEIISKQDEEAEVELGDLFCEETSASASLPPEVLNSQKKEKAALLSGGYFSSKIDEIWKKVKKSDMRLFSINSILLTYAANN